MLRCAPRILRSEVLRDSFLSEGHGKLIIVTSYIDAGTAMVDNGRIGEFVE